MCYTACFRQWFLLLLLKMYLKIPILGGSLSDKGYNLNMPTLRSELSKMSTGGNSV